MRAPADDVLIVDRDPAVAEALARLLVRKGHHARHASFAVATAHAVRLPPTVVLVDADGDAEVLQELVETLRLTARGVRVLLLTGDSDGQALQRRTGALGWVSRYGGPEELDQALRTSRSGAPLPAPGVRRPGAADRRGGRLRGLTDRELLVLRALVAGQRTGDIATTFGISPHTVRTHVQNILSKLDARTRTEAGMVALQSGLTPLEPALAPAMA